MNAITTHREVVVLIRELRDGTVTEERLERWLAELVAGCIPGEEPNVAKARIVRLPVETYRRNPYPVKRANRQTIFRTALALARAAYGADPLLGYAPLVA
ncbi:MAG TPA: hypothetical protein VJ754_04000 [Anaerolineae bacterium]|nr:hypothetical protein [Anaerolineae bacterium]